MPLSELIRLARQTDASDLHITEDRPVYWRVQGRLAPCPQQPVDSPRAMILGLISPAQQRELEAGQDLDFALTHPEGGRLRVNVFRTRGRLAAAIRLLPVEIPALETLNLPPVLTDLAMAPSGLILVTGPTGSGKSTTLAAMVDHILRQRPCHVLTIEDPIEYLYQSGLVHQREIGREVPSYAAALRSALREDPDVILVGEMRDYPTMAAVLTAAETGHLVLSTLHTVGAPQTVDRILDLCPAPLHRQILGQLASVLRGILTQQLLPPARGTRRRVATELLLNNEAVSSLIREGHSYKLTSALQANAAVGMHTMNSSLARQTMDGLITRATALQASPDVKDLAHYL